MALELVLRTLMSSPEFSSLQEKNWDAISRLIPGTTPWQCSRKYQELQQEADQFSSVSSSLASAIGSSTKPEEQASRLVIEKPIDLKTADDSQSPRPTEVASTDQGPIMVIHVLDEQKSLKQDFQCPRDLLIREMRYFAEYLLTDAQRWEEVDISVHCDVQIFDWLMRYTKRGQGSSVPQLEPTNVISILISSDFLKMDSLVAECVGFCHKHMSEIIATPSNMNCVSDKLVARIADMFTHTEAEQIKDRKDKFKSKIFQKKIERLFDADYKNPDSDENASTLFKCDACQKLLTSSTKDKFNCIPSRLNVGTHGELVYVHKVDSSWDVNTFLLQQKTTLRTWRDVYWRLWGTINYLHCERCQQWFPCTELGNCSYHPESALFENILLGQKPKPYGTHGCCGAQVLRFDPIALNVGCEVGLHIVNVPEDIRSSEGDRMNAGRDVVLKDLLAHREAIVSAVERSHSISAGDVNVFLAEEVTCGLRVADSTTRSRSAASIISQPGSLNLVSMPSLSFCAVSSDIDSEDASSRRSSRRSSARSRVTVEPQAILSEAPSYNADASMKWDGTRSIRFNQDIQRQEDHRRMKEITQLLVKLRHNPEKLEKLRQKEPAGGIFARLEAQWKTAHIKADKPTAHVPPMRSKTKVMPSASR